MPPYHRLGEVPHKRHTQFRRPDGGLFHEELFGTEGFSGPYSLLYHYNPPPRVARIEKRADLTPQPWRPEGEVHRVHLLKTRTLAAGGDAVTGRTPLLFNGDVTLAAARPAESMDYYYRNGDGDELIFVHEGRGRLESVFGHIPFGPGDYLVIPRGTTFRITLEGEGCRLLVVEARGGAIEPPNRYRNAAGQLLEHAPYHERDIRLPADLEAHPDGGGGEHEVRVKVGGVLYGYTYDFHPLDVAGWDGQLYPWAFSIHDFEPITGRIHQPPTVHQTFQGPNFVVCSFVSRKLDYHPQAVPVPYNHSNIDSDEVLYYVSGNFTSRRGVEPAALTLHPRGIPHGPHPGAVEASLGKTETDEMAVMVDTFRPLTPAAACERFDDPDYPASWR